jgi:adenylate cyclase
MVDPEQTADSPKTEDVAVLFADLAGSSALYRQLGDATAKECIENLLNTLVALAERYGGQLIKSIGDEVMLCFASAENAGISAVKIQEQAAALGFAMRIGVSYGPAVIDDGDVFGDTVNQAAFLTGMALAHQIILAEETVYCLPAYLRSSCQQFDQVVIKGGERKTQVYRLNWQSKDDSLDATRVNPHPGENPRAPRLILDVDGTECEVTSKTPPLHLGRDSQQVDLTVHAKEASRDHCHLLFHRGKYVLVDHSTNGTYIHTEGQPEAYIRRESTPLFGSGRISLGQPCDETSACISYRTII